MLEEAQMAVVPVDIVAEGTRPDGTKWDTHLLDGMYSEDPTIILNLRGPNLFFLAGNGSLQVRFPISFLEELAGTIEAHKEQARREKAELEAEEERWGSSE